MSEYTSPYAWIEAGRQVQESKPQPPKNFEEAEERLRIELAALTTTEESEKYIAYISKVAEWAAKISADYLPHYKDMLHMIWQNVTVCESVDRGYIGIATIPDTYVRSAALITDNRHHSIGLSHEHFQETFDELKSAFYQQAKGRSYQLPNSSIIVDPPARLIPLNEGCENEMQDEAFINFLTHHKGFKFLASFANESTTDKRRLSESEKNLRLLQSRQRVSQIFGEQSLRQSEVISPNSIGATINAQRMLTTERLRIEDEEVANDRNKTTTPGLRLRNWLLQTLQKRHPEKEFGIAKNGIVTSEGKTVDDAALREIAVLIDDTAYAYATQFYEETLRSIADGQGWGRLLQTKDIDWYRKLTGNLYGNILMLSSDFMRLFFNEKVKPLSKTEYKKADEIACLLHDHVLPLIKSQATGEHRSCKSPERAKSATKEDSVSFVSKEQLERLKKQTIGTIEYSNADEQPPLRIVTSINSEAPDITKPTSYDLAINFKDKATTFEVMGYTLLGRGEEGTLFYQKEAEDPYRACLEPIYDLHSYDDKFWSLRMHQLNAWLVEKERSNTPIVVEELVRQTRASMQYSFNFSGKYAIKSIEDLTPFVNDGTLHAQCTLSDKFGALLLGDDFKISSISGYTIKKDSNRISAVEHKQTVLHSATGKKYILDFTPPLHEQEESRQQSDQQFNREARFVQTPETICQNFEMWSKAITNHNVGKPSIVNERFARHILNLPATDPLRYAVIAMRREITGKDPSEALTACDRVLRYVEQCEDLAIQQRFSINRGDAQLKTIKSFFGDLKKSLEVST